MKNILFVAVHPDDETLGCGGAILKHKDNGDNIYWMIITAPTLNHPYGFNQDFIKKRNDLVKQIAGEYTINWNGDNHQNKTAASGLYFYRLKLNGKQTMTKKCLLLK